MALSIVQVAVRSLHAPRTLGLVHREILEDVRGVPTDASNPHPAAKRCDTPVVMSPTHGSGAWMEELSFPEWEACATPPSRGVDGDGGRARESNPPIPPCEGTQRF